MEGGKQIGKWCDLADQKKLNSNAIGDVKRGDYKNPAIAVSSGSDVIRYYYYR